MSEVVTMEKLKEWKLDKPFEGDLKLINKAANGFTADECAALALLFTYLIGEKVKTDGMTDDVELNAERMYNVLDQITD